MTILRRQTIGYVNLLVGMIVLAGLSIGWLVWQGSWQDKYDDAIRQVDTVTQIETKAQSMVSASTGWSLNTVVKMILDDTWGTAEIGKLGEATAELTPLFDTLAALKSINANDRAAVDSMRTLATQHEQGANAAYAIAIENQTQTVTIVEEQVSPAAQQLLAAATAFKESGKAQQVKLLDQLDRYWTIVFWVMIAWTALAVVAGLAFNAYLGRVTKRHLNAAVGSIGASAAELLAISSQVAAGAAQTAVSTNETTATVEEVKQTAQLAHEKAAQVAESSENVTRVAETGQATVEETISGIERMQSEMVLVGETIQRLSDQTQAVGDIISTVNDIAEQSNLLSVNASIEAAKAGEQGKGFIVVAQEVKSLAEQSKQAVAQVRNILSEIQKASTLAVEAADRSREAVEAGRRQSVESGQAIHALSESIGEAAQSALQISASSQQQLAGMEQISQAIESISQASGQSVSGTRQVEQEVKNLQDLALSLKRLVDNKATI